MSRNHWRSLAPSLIVATGVLASALLAGVTAGAGFWVLSGPLLLALSVVTADSLQARLRGLAPRPSPAALILGATCVLAAAILMLRNPGHIATLLQIMGPAIWVTRFLPGAARGPEKCWTT